jgi:hypothetical protein
MNHLKKMATLSLGQIINGVYGTLIRRMKTVGFNELPQHSFLHSNKRCYVYRIIVRIPVIASKLRSIRHGIRTTIGPLMTPIRPDRHEFNVGRAVSCYRVIVLHNNNLTRYSVLYISATNISAFGRPTHCPSHDRERKKRAHEGPQCVIHVGRRSVARATLTRCGSRISRCGSRISRRQKGRNLRGSIRWCRCRTGRRLPEPSNTKRVG